MDRIKRKVKREPANETNIKHFAFSSFVKKTNNFWLFILDAWYYLSSKKKKNIYNIYILILFQKLKINRSYEKYGAIGQSPHLDLCSVCRIQATQGTVSVCLRGEKVNIIVAREKEKERERWADKEKLRRYFDASFSMAIEMAAYHLALPLRFFQWWTPRDLEKREASLLSSVVYDSYFKTPRGLVLWKEKQEHSS